MVTMTLDDLLEQKTEYAVQWPAGRATMPWDVRLAYSNLLTEIKAAGKRCQMTLPLVDMSPVPPEGQDMMNL